MVSRGSHAFLNGPTPGFAFKFGGCFTCGKFSLGVFLGNSMNGGTIGLVHHAFASPVQGDGLLGRTASVTLVKVRSPRINSRRLSGICVIGTSQTGMRHIAADDTGSGGHVSDHFVRSTSCLHVGGVSLNCAFPQG